MYYDLKSFGQSVCKIRNNLGYTQKHLSELTALTTETIRKIENGKVIPTQITLELLSIALKEDLNLLLLKYRIIDHKKYYEIKEQIEHKLENGNYDDLENDYEKLNIILKDTYLNNYEHNSIKQLSLLVKSIILKINNQDYIGSLNTLIDAMKLTTPLFELDNYNEFVYSNIEIRILMNIALLINRLESTNKCIDILLFCLKSLSPDEIDFKLKYNSLELYFLLLRLLIKFDIL